MAEGEHLARRDLRAADADRAKVADRLRVALDEGRLTLDEYDERLQRTYAAKTYGDLDGLLTDLPVTDPGRARVAPRQPAHPPPAPRPADAGADPTGGADSLGRWLAGVWGAWLIAVLVNVVIWASVSVGTRDLVYFWPIWVGGPWGAILLSVTIAGVATGRAGRSRRRHRGWQPHGRYHHH